MDVFLPINILNCFPPVDFKSFHIFVFVLGWATGSKSFSKENQLYTMPYDLWQFYYCYNGTIQHTVGRSLNETRGIMEQQMNFQFLLFKFQLF